MLFQEIAFTSPQGPTTQLLFYESRVYNTLRQETAATITAHAPPIQQVLGSIIRIEILKFVVDTF